MSDIAPHVSGKIAYAEGEPISVIPSDLTLDEYEAWRMGWEDAWSKMTADAHAFGSGFVCVTESGVKHVPVCEVISHNGHTHAKAAGAGFGDAIGSRRF